MTAKAPLALPHTEAPPQAAGASLGFASILGLAPLFAGLILLMISVASAWSMLRTTQIAHEALEVSAQNAAIQQARVEMSLVYADLQAALSRAKRGEGPQTVADAADRAFDGTSTAIDRIETAFPRIADTPKVAQLVGDMLQFRNIGRVATNTALDTPDFTREHGANLAMRYQGIVRQFIEQQGHFSELAISSSYAIGESWTQHNWIIAATFLLGLALMFAASRFLIQSATAPLQALLTQTEHVADGFLDETLVGQDRPDEIGRLASAIERLRMIAEQHRRLSHKSRLQDREMELARLQTEQMRRQMATKDEQMAQHRKFVSIVSHEFRTPLTIIDAQARATLRRLGTQTQEQTAKRMNAIVGGVERLVDMIESVLSSARLEAGSLKAEPSRIDLGNLVADTVGLHSALNSTHEISVDVDELPQDFLADPKLLRQVITNLLTNAIKYSPNGDPIEVLGRLQGEEVVVSVVDQGVGIPPHEIAKLSTPYYRASTATGIPGTGIGLNIVRTFVEMHGGRLEIRSQTGKGSTFSVFLPAKGIPMEDVPTGQMN